MAFYAPPPRAFRVRGAQEGAAAASGLPKFAFGCAPVAAPALYFNGAGCGGSCGRIANSPTANRPTLNLVV